VDLSELAEENSNNKTKEDTKRASSKQVEKDKAVEEKVQLKTRSYK